jgi:hypothetical protein
VQQAWRPESDGMFARRAQPSPDGKEKRGLVKEPWIELWRSLQRRSSAGQGGDDEMRWELMGKETVEGCYEKFGGGR